MMRLLVLCNPQNRRTKLLGEAAKRTGWKLQILAYEDVLSGRANPKIAYRHCDAVRIESPGEDFSVEQRLLMLGAAQDRGPSEAESANPLTYELGRIHSPWHYFLGFKSLLESIDASLNEATWMNSPQAVITMFNKPATLAYMQANQVPIPRQFGAIASFDAFAELLEAQQLRRVFVKFATSSSASGVVAIAKQGEQLRATTTVEVVSLSNGRVQLYNSLKLQHLTELKEIRRLIDSLADYHIFAEEWLPKASYDHRSTFDLRAVVVNGQPTHFVPRVSASPITNLHLGNRRGNWPTIRSRINTHYDALASLCSKAVEAIPGTFYAGLDIVVHPNQRRFHLLEANACGDLLPGIVGEKGDDTYSAQLRALELKISGD